MDTPSLLWVKKKLYPQARNFMGTPHPRQILVRWGIDSFSMIVS